MYGTNLTITAHARQRMSERSIPRDAVYAALSYGFAFRCGEGKVTHFISKKVILDKPYLEPYNGTGVVVNPGKAIVTVFKNAAFRPKVVKKRYNLK